MSVRLKPAAKIMILLAVVGIAFGAYWFGFRDKGGDKDESADKDGKDGKDGKDSKDGKDGKAKGAKDTYKIALSEWPGHMAFVIGNGGLTTQPGSAAAEEGIKLEIVFIEDPVKKNLALQTGNVDFVWQVVDEMPINMGSYKTAGVDARAY